MKFSLREFIQRIAWKRTIIILSSCFLAYYIFTHDISCRLKVPSLKLPDISIIPQHTDNQAFSTVALAMVLITLIAIIKLLTRRRDD